MAADIDTSTALVAEQFAHACDLLKAEMHRQSEQIDTLKAQVQDFETRIRDLTATATQFKFLAALATGGGALSIIALLQALISP
jgi:tetrahydromethanopterin S-methyltransferase subunit B